MPAPRPHDPSHPRLPSPPGNPRAAHQARGLLSALLDLKWALWIATLTAGIGMGITIALLHRPETTENAAELPVETWAAGVRRAPAFTLTNQNGKPVSLTALRGRPVIVTFIDPLCRNFCPREASIISQAVKNLTPDQPAIVAVSVDPWGDTRQSFQEDALHWRLAPQWQWGIGTQAQLAAVWRRYQIGVTVTQKTIAGITVREITHTAAAYLIDSSGHVRALLLYPFDAAEVDSAMHTMLTTTT